jgi:hypothetical protein
MRVLFIRHALEDGKKVALGFNACRYLKGVGMKSPTPSHDANDHKPSHRRSSELGGRIGIPMGSVKHQEGISTFSMGALMVAETLDWTNVARAARLADDDIACMIISPVVLSSTPTRMNGMRISDHPKCNSICTAFFYRERRTIWRTQDGALTSRRLLSIGYGNLTIDQAAQNPARC